MKNIGRSMNINDTVLVDSVTLNATTAVTIQAVNEDRIFFCVNNNDATKAFWIRLYPASKDNIKQGIFITSKTGQRIFWQMPTDNIYTGEISAIAEVDSPVAYTNEY